MTTAKSEEGLTLDGASGIRAWVDANPPAFAKTQEETREGVFITSVLVEPPGETRLFGVEHSIYKPDGYPLLMFARVYAAVDPRHALHQYLYSEMPERRYGRGVDHVYIKLYDLDFTYQAQEIRVFPLWEGTDQFE
jgi:hypothetical protein